ncbi:MAG TPA: (2Fe-2S)-binding protein [Luteimonas sp.]|nr:(2Fe-2S)-binding protein [Luteimonas sp.]
MYVCVCNGVTDRDIRQGAQAGCGSMAELTMRTGCGACCGSCVEMATRLLEEARAQSQPACGDNVVAFPRIPHAA